MLFCAANCKRTKMCPALSIVINLMSCSQQVQKYLLVIHFNTRIAIHF